MDDIWSSGILTFDSPLKDLLDTNDYTLEDLLNEDELLQEVKGCHPQLKVFFNEERNVAGLIKCLLRSTPPPPPPSTSVAASISADEETSSQSLALSASLPRSTKGEDVKGEEQEPFPHLREDGMADDNSNINDDGDYDDDHHRDQLNNGHNDHQHQHQQEQTNEATSISITNLSNEEEESCEGNATDMKNDMNDNTNANVNVNINAAIHPGGNDNDSSSTNTPLDSTSSTTANNNNSSNFINNNTNALSTSSIEKENDTTHTNNNTTHSSNDTESSSSSPSSSSTPPSSSQPPQPGLWLLNNITEEIEPRSSTSRDHNGLLLSSALLTQEEYDKIYVRYPYMACEVICCENDDILDIIVYGTVDVIDDNYDDDNHNHNDEKESSSNEHKMKKIRRRRQKKQSLLDILFSVLYTTPPSQLDDRTAGYLEKVLTLLFRTRPKVMESYLNGDHLVADDDEEHEEEEEHDNKEIMQEIISEGNESDSDDYVFSGIHQGGGTALLDALFNHLHSNSISQIVQSLLIPKPPSKSNDDELMNQNGSTNNTWGDSEAQQQHDNEDNDEDYNDDNLITSGMEDVEKINCNWADGEYAINLLLERLLGESDVLDDLLDDEKSSPATDRDAMTRFDCSQNASDILITIIQHSTLSSNVMKMMTTSDVLSKLIECSCSSYIQKSLVDDVKSVQSFSRHESTMTTAMAVLETLILQLGGYGTLPDSTEDSDNETEMPYDEKVNQEQNSIKEANLSSLIQLLPSLLTRLNNLLNHPDTNEWTSEVQYSNEPQKLLGASRLRIVRLIESLALLGNSDVDHVLCQSDCLETCIKLFWEFPWCSMLHQSVANLLVHILEGGNTRKKLQHYFIHDCNLMERLMKSFHGIHTFSDGYVTNSQESIPNGNSDNDRHSINHQGNTLNLSDDHEENVTILSGDQFVTKLNETDSIPVSDDDIDSALEQEEFEKMNGHTNDPNHSKCDRQITDTTKSISIISEIEESSLNNEDMHNDGDFFRTGYMGHVIIICQALVHACGISENTISSQTNIDEEVSINNECGKDLCSERKNIIESKVKDTMNGICTQDINNNSLEQDSIMMFVRGHSAYSDWVEFMATTFATETSIQSTLLGGGCNHLNESTLMTGLDQIPPSNDTHLDHDIGEISKGTYSVNQDEGGIDIDNNQFDDAEIDIAASLMHNINLPSSAHSTEDNNINGTGTHHRRRGVLGGEGSGNISGSEFGTVVQMHQGSGDYYQYDDPLGQWQQKFPDNMAFEDSHFDDQDFDEIETEEKDVPVLNLFTGNINFDEVDGQSNDTAWANFDEGFGGFTNNDDSQIIDSSPDPFDTPDSSSLIDDVFGQPDTSLFDDAFDDKGVKVDGNKSNHFSTDASKQ